MTDDDEIETNPIFRIDPGELAELGPVTAPPPEHATLLADLGWLQLWTAEEGD